MLGKLVAGCFLAFWIVFWSAATLTFDFALVRGAAAQLRAINYPSVPGVITHSEVEATSDEDGTVFVPRLAYTYSVQNKEYKGSTYRRGATGDSGGTAARIVAEHPVGKHIPVIYNPDEPFESLLQAGLSGGDFFMAMFLTPFNLVMVGSWCLAWYAVRPLPRNRAFAGYRVWVDPDGRLQIVVCNPGPLWAAVTALGVSFFLVFVVGLGFGGNPSLGVMALVWTVILTCTVAAYRLALPSGSTPRKLVLDAQSATVAIFRRSKTIPDCTIAASAIESVAVDATEEKDSDGDLTRSFTPVLTFHDEDGHTSREELGVWRSEQLPTSLADGLRDWLQQCGHPARF